MSELENCIREAYEKGYKVIDGQVYSPSGRKLSLRKNPKNGRFDFGYYKQGKGKRRIHVHRLVAYQKYGELMFEKGIECRHLDDNKENNLDDNISIGTHSDNMMDVPRADRIARSKIARQAAKEVTIKHNAESIKKAYRETKSYKKVMEMFNISSKGTLNYILNKR